MRNRIPLGCKFVMLHFASLISHNLRCIPAYTHLIPTGFFQSSLNNHRDNFYIFFYAPTPSAQKKPCPFKNHQFCTKKMQLSSKTAFFLVQFLQFPALFQCNLVYLHKYKWYGQIIQFFQTQTRRNLNRFSSLQIQRNSLE